VVLEERVEASDEGLLRGCRVLLAEDNAINRRVAVGLLERLGCVVQTVENGRLAVERWREGGWDVVVMDMQMPELDGLEATRLIRQAEALGQLAPVPILAMTANAFAEDKDACLSAGMDDVLTKPASKASLYVALLRLVEARRESPLRASA
jgi:CheY-like chemotaxis protein